MRFFLILQNSITDHLFHHTHFQMFVFIFFNHKTPLFARIFTCISHDFVFQFIYFHKWFIFFLPNDSFIFRWFVHVRLFSHVFFFFFSHDAIFSPDFGTRFIYWKRKRYLFTVCSFTCIFSKLNLFSHVTFSMLYVFIFDPFLPKTHLLSFFSFLFLHDRFDFTMWFFFIWCIFFYVYLISPYHSFIFTSRD